MSYIKQIIPLLCLSIFLIACASDNEANPSSETPPLTTEAPSIEKAEQTNNTSLAPQTLEVGAIQQGEIFDQDHSQNWTFVGKSNQELSIEANGAGLTDPFLSLLDSNGNQIASDDDSGGGLDASITISLPADDTYTVAVQAYNAGPYQISLNNAEETLEQTESQETNSQNTDNVTLGEIIFEESFDDNTADWEVDTADFTSTIANGHYTIDWPLSSGYRWNVRPGWTDWEKAPIMTEPYQFEVDINNVQFSTENGNIPCLILFINYQQYALFSSWNQFEFCHSGNSSGLAYNTLLWNNDGEFLQQRGASTEFNNSELPNPDTTNFITQSRRIGIRVEEKMYTFLVDGEPIATIPSTGTIDGSIAIGVTDSKKDNSAEGSFYMEMDNVSIHKLNTLTTEPLYGEVFYQETFDQNDLGWPVNPNIGWAIYDSAYHMDLAFSSTSRSNYIGRVYPDFDLAPSITEPYEVSVEVSDLYSEIDDYLTVILGVNAQTIEFPSLSGPVPAPASLFFRINGNGSWVFLGGGSGKYIKEIGVLPSNLDLLDGNTYKLAVRIEESSRGLLLSLLVDDQLVGQVTDFTGISSDDVLWPLFDGINGSIVFGADATGANNLTNQPARMGATFDNLTIRGVRPPALPSGTGIGPLTETFVSDNERLTFQYPSSWVFNDRIRVYEDKPNELVFNLSLANSAQGITGADNEMSLQIYEPVMVMEETAILDTSQASLSEVLAAFVSNRADSETQFQAPEEIALGERKAIQQIGSNGVHEVIWLALRSSDDTVTLLEGSIASGQMNALAPTIFAIAKTVDYVAPSQTLDAAEESLRQYLLLTNSGLLDTAVNSRCLGDAISLQVTGLLLDDLGQQEGAIAFDPLKDFTETSYTIDDKHRYFETVEQTDEWTLIRVSGNVLIRYDDNSEQIVPNNEFYIDFLKPFFGGDVYYLFNEDGVWKPCSGLIGVNE